MYVLSRCEVSLGRSSEYSTGAQERWPYILLLLESERRRSRINQRSPSIPMRCGLRTDIDYRWMDQVRWWLSFCRRSISLRGTRSSLYARLRSASKRGLRNDWYVATLWKWCLSLVTGDHTLFEVVQSVSWRALLSRESWAWLCKKQRWQRDVADGTKAKQKSHASFAKHASVHRMPPWLMA